MGNPHSNLSNHASVFTAQYLWCGSVILGILRYENQALDVFLQVRAADSDEAVLDQHLNVGSSCRKRDDFDPQVFGGMKS
jgi:hypothetical protein